MIVNYKLGNELISLELIGETYSGTDEILLLQDENLIENTKASIWTTLRNIRTLKLRLFGVSKSF